MKREGVRGSGQGRRSSRMRGRKNKPGFTLIETLVSILIITTGILSLAAVYAQGLAVNSKTQFDYIAQAKAEEALETIFAARDSGQITWAQIQNTCSSTTGTTGIFLCGPQPLLAPGPDGLYGTADDDATNPNVIIAGPNSSGVLGTTAGTPAPGDVVIPLTFMTREIQIASLVTDGSLRQVTIIMRYTVAGSPRTYTLVSCISQPS